ncbi:MAG: hypothetical protein ACRDY7_17420 [Acidimicrobiia bacterium]
MVAAALGVALLAACASGDGSKPTLNVDEQQVATSTLRGIVDGLCAAREQAAENREASRSAFLGRAHDPIHTLARAVQVTDRAAAGELLRAKQAVEADFGEAAGGGDLEGDLQHLVEETVRALKVVGIKAKECPE